MLCSPPYANTQSLGHDKEILLKAVPICTSTSSPRVPRTTEEQNLNHTMKKYYTCGENFIFGPPLGGNQT